MTKETKTPKKARITGKRVSKKIGVLWIMAFSLFLAEALIYTWCRVQCIQIGYAINDETQRQQQLRTLNNSLKIELAHLKAPDTLSRIARNQLALGMPDPKQIIVVP